MAGIWKGLYNTYSKYKGSNEQGSNDKTSDESQHTPEGNGLNISTENAEDPIELMNTWTKDEIYNDTTENPALSTDVQIDEMTASLGISDNETVEQPEDMHIGTNHLSSDESVDNDIFVSVSPTDHEQLSEPIVEQEMNNSAHDLVTDSPNAVTDIQGSKTDTSEVKVLKADVEQSATGTDMEKLRLESGIVNTKCNLCKDMFIDSDLKRCNECEITICRACTTNHELERHTATSMATDFTQRSFCEICLHNDKHIKSSKICRECDEILCSSCVTVHRTQKATRSHLIYDMKTEVTPDLSKGYEQQEYRMYCEPCSYNNIRGIPAEFVCMDCDDYLCNSCYTTHKAQKASREHNVKHIEKDEPKMCDPCYENGYNTIAKLFCKNCQECFCQTCSKTHRGSKSTRDHKVINIEDVSEKVHNEKCATCHNRSKDVQSEFYCRDCRDPLCELCKTRHQRMAATRSHLIVSIEEYNGQTQTGIRECMMCLEEGNIKEAVAFCSDCMPQEYMCTDCSEYHKATRATRQHRLEYSSDCQDRLLKISAVPSFSRKLGKGTYSQDSYNKPGKPFSDGPPQADSIRLRWNPPEQVYRSFNYQIRYKPFLPDHQWKLYEDPQPHNSVTLQNLQSSTQFIFQVRMVSNDEEGPYSEQSDVISTLESAANQLLDFSMITTTTETGLTIRKVPLEQNRHARNNSAKTRKFFIGNPSKIDQHEKTILLVGATGSGKSTMVDGFINYILGVNWDDPFRFSLIDLEDEEKRTVQNQALSQTHWITTYTINPVKGARLDYTINIIDTPGFGDTRGFERDQRIVEQIRELFSATDETGVTFLDCVCFLVKAPDARLTPTQRYIFGSILSLFGQDIEKNITMLTTFADGNQPPVIAALQEAQLPYNSCFTFNNSALFADNGCTKMSTLAPMFWEMGRKSFAEFFAHLLTMPTTSLQQTKEVLNQRNQIEITIENLTPLVNTGLNTLESLRIEIMTLEQHKTEIEANKNFKYEVVETRQIKIDLPVGQHVTNCLHCHTTCHKKCRIPKDENKAKCKVMDRNGDCTQCSYNCHWSQHSNTPYIFEYAQHKELKTYSEMLERYEIASGEKMSHEKVVERMHAELNDLEDDILTHMQDITDCNNILKDIALRPNPLTILEHIDLLIENEKQEKQPGFQGRINVLSEFRKKSNINESVQRFQQGLTNTRSTLGYHVRIVRPPRKGKKKGNMFAGIAGLFRN